MAVDSKDDGDDHEDDKELAAERKARAARNLIKSQRTVETALDDFIARANEKILDVSGFDAAAREKELQEEIAALKAKLAAAEDAARTQPSMKAKPAPVAAPVEPERIVETKMAWGPVLGAFVVGAALMFGFNMITKKDAPAPAQTAQPAPTQPAPQPAMAQQPSVEPIAPTPVEPPPTQPTPPTPTEQTQVTQAPTGTQAQTPKQPKPKQPGQPKQPKQPTTNTTENTNTTTTNTQPKQPTPPAAGSGSGELFNPF